jgi:hypothetical protein
MYSEFRLTTVLQFWQNAYCDADYERCRRHALTAEGRPVPVNMLPNGKLMETAPGK